MNTPTVLIAGARGFLGRHLTACFAGENWRVVGLARPHSEAETPEGVDRFVPMDLPDGAVADVIAEEKPAVLVNVTGTALIGASFADPAHDFRQNTGVAVALLEAVRRARPACRVVQISSAAVYGNPARLPMREDDPPAPISPYGFHKWQAEIACREYARLHGLEVCIARVFSAYGQGLHRQVIWDLTRRLAAGGDVELAGTGVEERDFIHAGDVARAVMFLAEKGDPSAGIYNIASGHSHTIRELVETLCRYLPAAATWRFGGQARPGNPDIWRVDVSRLRALGFEPEVDFESGLAETIRWIASEL